VDNKCTLRISIVLAIRMPKVKNYRIRWKFDEVQKKTTWVIFWHTL